MKPVADRTNAQFLASAGVLISYTASPHSDDRLLHCCYPGVKSVRVADLQKGLPGVQVVEDGAAAAITASGTFKGVQGVSSEVTTKQSPYNLAGIEVADTV